MPATNTCTKNILKDNPCLACLSEKELLGLKAYVWIVAAYGSGSAATINSVINQVACMDCLGKKQLLQAEVSIEMNEFSSNETLAQHLADAKRMANISEERLLAIIALAKCTYWNAH